METDVQHTQVNYDAKKSREHRLTRVGFTKNLGIIFQPEFGYNLKCYRHLPVGVHFGRNPLAISQPVGDGKRTSINYQVGKLSLAPVH